MEGNGHAAFVTVAQASQAANVGGRTLRTWIANGKLAGLRGKQGWLVNLAEVEELAGRRSWKPGTEYVPSGQSQSSSGHADEPASQPASPPIATDTRAQLAQVRDEWLMPLVDRIGALERENGELRQRIREMELRPPRRWWQWGKPRSFLSE